MVNEVFGSGRVEVAESLDAMVNVGAKRFIEIEENKLYESEY